MQNGNCFNINLSEQRQSNWQIYESANGLHHAFLEELNESQMLHILDASSGTLALIFGVLLNGLFQLEKDAHGCFLKENP